MGKADYQWSTRDCLDQTRTLDLTIDPTIDGVSNNGAPPPAILLSRMIQAIVRRCPNLEITLRFAHCHCGLTPISVLAKETFPRVTKLIVHVGNTEPDGTHVAVPVRHRRSIRTCCMPNAGFWQPFVNGDCFPDCKNLEIRHHWATTPPTNASLKLRAGVNDFSDPYSRGRQSVTTTSIGATSGLKKLESILLEATPELNSPLLMLLLGNPNSVAAKLTTLDLRHCDLDEETMSKLLYHAPPNLKHLALICRPRRTYSYDAHDSPHLCPLIREFAKNLVHLEFASPSICRELFFDDLERESLRKSGITTGIGDLDGQVEGSEKLDTVLIRDTIEACRRQKRTKYRNERVNQAITTAKATSSSTATSTSLFGGATTANNATVRAQRETEFTLDDEEESRRRLIEGSKTRWFRRFIAWGGLCCACDTWAEIQLAADMEEKGIELVVASEYHPHIVSQRPPNDIIDNRIRLASQHSNGKPARDIGLDQALEEKFDFEPRAFFAGHEEFSDEEEEDVDN